MKGYEISEKIMNADNKKHPFIKWWRKENDFADIEEVSVFVDNLNPNHEFAGFELITMDELWAELKRRQPKRVTLGKQNGETVIRWQRRGESGFLEEEVYPYNPHSLMVIFDAETGGTIV